MQLFHHIKDFVAEHLIPEQPVLLALSGGPDSMALLHLLQSYRDKYPLQLHIAHVDHRWRKSSGDEARQLRSYCTELGLPFHLKILEDVPTANLEDSARNRRYSFFEELCNTHHFQAVITAHHRGDLAETTLKRILEGASLTRIGAMTTISKRQNLTLWRPLLDVNKTQLTEYASTHKLPVIHDASNADTRFLRARMRQSILPSLQESFGKNIIGTLSLLSEESHQLRDYLDQQISPILSQAVTGPWGVYVDLSTSLEPHPCEIQHLVRTLCRSYDIHISRQSLHAVSALLVKHSANKNFSSNNGTVFVDRGRLFVTKDSLPPLPETALTLDPGRHSWGAWTVDVTEANESAATPNWKALWKGEFCVTLPKHSYTLKVALPTDRIGPKALDSLWQERKVPAFLRAHVPGIYLDSAPYCELLTGALATPTESGSPLLKISLSVSFQHK